MQWSTRDKVPGLKEFIFQGKDRECVFKYQIVISALKIR